MKEHFKNLKNLIDGNGKFIGTEEEKKVPFKQQKH